MSLALQTSDVLSILAVLIALGSLGISLYSTVQDRPRLRIRSLYFTASEYGAARIQIVLVNVGRRPVILRMFGGYNSAGEHMGTILKSEQGGLRLAEHERYEFIVRKEDVIDMTPDGEEFVYVQLWVEDSLGNRHPVPNSEGFIRRLLGT